MESLSSLWEVVLETWNTTAVGKLSVGDVFLILFFIVVFFLLRRLFTYFIIGSLRRLTRRTKTNLDDRVLDVMEQPLRLIPIAIGLFLALQIVEPRGVWAEGANNVIKSLVAISIFWAAFNVVDPLYVLMERLERIFTHAMVEWFTKFIKAIIIFAGAATVLEIWGIEIGPVLAGLGLIGVAVALGAQDLFKNLIAGILTIVERRLNKGDWVRVESVVEGTVENVGFRSTTVRRFDKALVTVPNAKFADNAVINFSEMTHRRIKWIIGVEYSTTLEQLRKIRDEIEAYVHGNDNFASPEEVSTFVRIDSFNDSSIDILLYCFTKTTNWGEWLKIKEDLAYKVKEIVEGAGTAFAFPSRTVYLEQPGEEAEVFVPPSTQSG